MVRFSQVVGILLVSSRVNSASWRSEPAQTLSRALPNAMVGRAFEALDVENQTVLADHPVMVELGLQKICGYQHHDGGWGCWD